MKPVSPASGRWWIVGQNLLSLAVVALGVGIRGQWHSAFGFWIGWILFSAAGSLGIAGVRALGANRTSSPNPRPQAQLVDHGAFRIVRHPLYLSLILGSLGWTLIWASLPAAGATLALTVLLQRKADVEERLLLTKFPAYESYQKRVGRLFPRSL